MTAGYHTWDYTYDANGMRTSRTDGTTTYTYLYSNGLLTQMTKNGVVLYFTYDAAGMPLTVQYNGTVYYYVTNLQGDVIAILDETGNEIAEYSYDAWGRLLNNINETEETIYSLNPLLYRGYVYDKETGLYYLQSRYYNPTWGRFVNIDRQFNPQNGAVGFNLFAYCVNNPTNCVDYTGTATEVLHWGANNYYEVFQGWVFGMSWLPTIDTVLPIGDIIYGAGIVIIGACAIVVMVDAYINSPVNTTTTEEQKLPMVQSSEHTKNARQSTKNKHQRGQRRKGMDNRGEKGDKRRIYLGNKRRLHMFVLFAYSVFESNSSDMNYPSVAEYNDAYLPDNDKKSVLFITY